MKQQTAQALLAAQLARTERLLRRERALAAFGPAAALAALWFGAALWGLLDWLAPTLRSALGAFALLAIAGLALRGRWRLQPPTRGEARARLAQDARLDAAVFEALEDRPTKLDPLTLAIWRKAQEQAAARLRSRAVRPARLSLRRIDPWRLRYGLGVLCLAGLIWAGGEAPRRLWEALLPNPGPLLGDKPLEIEAWAAPAAYTHAAPIPMRERVGETIATPPALDVVVRVSGPVGAPVLRYTQHGRDLALRLSRAPDGSFEGRLPIARSGTLRLSRFHQVAHWRLALAADAAPKASFAAPPAVEDETLTVSWSAGDDFGVQRAVLRVEPAVRTKALAGAGPIDTELSLAGEAAEVSAEAVLTPVEHPYAGMEVSARIVAIDGAGQEGASEPLVFQMPERLFLQPLARAALEVRRDIQLEQRPYAHRPGRQPALVLRVPGPGMLEEEVELDTAEADPRLERAPEAILAAARKLDALTMRPEDGYFRNLAVFMGLRAARAQIDMARNQTELAGAAAILWDVAMFVEYGSAADAREALALAQQALADALRRGADQEEIRRLSKRVREATQAYLRALREEALREKRTAQPGDQGGGGTRITRNEIDALLQEVERLSAAGEHEAAAQLLEKISALLENLQMSLAAGQGGADGEGGEEQNSELREQLDALSDAIGEQRGLQNETERLERGGDGGESAPSRPGRKGAGQSPSERAEDTAEGLGRRQQALRERLTAAERDLPGDQADARAALGRAGEAMKRAEEALRRSDLPSARKAQNEALEGLRAGAARLGKAMDAQRAKPEPARNGPRDPLGRPFGGADDGSGTAVPEEMERQRVREILDVLRERASDPRRPAAEREYLRRLLDRFGESS